jgi:hypothetical protein
MAEPKLVGQQLRTIEDLTNAYEWLYEQTRAGKLDNKTADVLNTVLKGATFLRGKLPLEYAKLYMASQVKKFDFPVGMLPKVAG